MKKHEILLLSLTVLFLGFAAGFLIGYGMPGSISPLPAQSESTPAAVLSATPKASPSAVPTQTPATSFRLNINTATKDELTALPGIGDKLAAEIIAFRTQNGLFGATIDIMQVSGIGEKKYAAIQDLICVAENGKLVL